MLMVRSRKVKPFLKREKRKLSLGHYIKIVVVVGSVGSVDNGFKVTRSL